MTTMGSKCICGLTELQIQLLRDAHHATHDANDSFDDRVSEATRIGSIANAWASMPDTLFVERHGGAGVYIELTAEGLKAIGYDDEDVAEILESRQRDRVRRAKELLHSVSTNAALKELGLTKSPRGNRRYDIVRASDGVVLLEASNVFQTSAWINAGCPASFDKEIV